MDYITVPLLGTPSAGGPHILLSLGLPNDLLWPMEHEQKWNVSILCVLSHFSRVPLFVTPWTVARQAPLSMGFSRQEYWSGMLFPSPVSLPESSFKPQHRFHHAQQTAESQIEATSSTWVLSQGWQGTEPWSTVVTQCKQERNLGCCQSLRCYHSITYPHWLMRSFGHLYWSFSPPV